MRCWAVGVSLNGVPERTRSLTSRRSIDTATGQPGDASEVTARRTGDGRGSWLFHNGEEPRRGRSTQGAERVPRPSNTPEDRGGNRGQPRCPLGSPWGDGRRIGGGAVAGERAPGRRKPTRGTASGRPSHGVRKRGFPGREASRTRPRIAPTDGGIPSARSSASGGGTNVVEVTGLRKEAPTDREEEAPEGRSP